MSSTGSSFMMPAVSASHTGAGMSNPSSPDEEGIATYPTWNERMRGSSLPLDTTSNLDSLQGQSPAVLFHQAHKSGISRDRGTVCFDGIGSNHFASSPWQSSWPTAATESSGWPLWLPLTPETTPANKGSQYSLWRTDTGLFFFKKGTEALQDLWQTRGDFRHLVVIGRQLFDAERFNESGATFEEWISPVPSGPHPVERPHPTSLDSGTLEQALKSAVDRLEKAACETEPTHISRLATWLQDLHQQVIDIYEHVHTELHRVQTHKGSFVSKAEQEEEQHCGQDCSETKTNGGRPDHHHNNNIVNGSKRGASDLLSLYCHGLLMVLLRVTMIRRVLLDLRQVHMTCSQQQQGRPSSSPLVSASSIYETLRGQDRSLRAFRHDDFYRGRQSDRSHGAVTPSSSFHATSPSDDKKSGSCLKKRNYSSAFEHDDDCSDSKCSADSTYPNLQVPEAPRCLGNTCLGLENQHEISASSSPNGTVYDLHPTPWRSLYAYHHRPLYSPSSMDHVSENGKSLPSQWKAPLAQYTHQDQEPRRRVSFSAGFVEYPSWPTPIINLPEAPMPEDKTEHQMVARAKDR